MSLERARAAALFSCFLLVAVPAAAASHVETQAPVAARSEPFDQAIGHAAGSESFSSAWTDAAVSGPVTPDQARITISPDAIFDPITFIPREGGGGLSSHRARSNSAVPLPTSLSLFGAGLLTLGLIGVFSGSQKRLALETGFLSDIENGLDPAKAAPPVRFRIEVRSEHGCQMRNTTSARGTIDMIADLLNEGWDVVCIRDGNGSAVDYEDLLDRWNHERSASR